MRFVLVFALSCTLLYYCNPPDTSNVSAENGQQASNSSPLQQSNSADLRDTTLANQLLKASIDSFNIQIFQESYLLADSALVLYEKLLGKHEKTAEAVNQAGRAKYMLSDMEEAIRLFKNAGDIQRAIKGENSEEVAQAYTNIGIALNKWGKFEQALVYHEKALALRLELFGSDHPTIASSYNSIGLICEKRGAYLEALEYYKKGNATLQAQEKIDTAALAVTTGNIGNIWQHLGDYEQALDYQFEALKMWERYKHSHREYYRTGVIGNIGVTFYEMGDYLQAIDYYLKSLSIWEELNYRDPIFVFSIYNNLGNAYNEVKKHAAAQNYFEQALELLLSNMPEQELYIATIYNNLGITSSKRGQYQQAISFYEKALHIAERKKDTLSIAFYELNRAANYAMLDDFKTAEAGLDKALSLWQPKLGPYHPYIASAYLDLGKIYGRQGKYDEALKFFSRTLQASRYGKKGFEGVSSLKYVMEALQEASTVYKSKFETSRAPIDLNEAERFAELSLAAMEYQSSQFQRQGSAMLWREQNYAYFENAIDIKLQKAARLNSTDYIWQAFLLADKAKTFALREHLRDMNALQFAGMPDSLIQKERELRTAITWHEKQRQEAISSGSKATDSLLLTLSGQLTDFRLGHQELKDQFEREYPSYYHLKYDEPDISATYLQEFLAKEGHHLVEYFVGDSNIYCFVVSQEKIEAKKLQRKGDLDTLVKQMRTGITGMVSKDGNATAATEQYAEAAGKLYEAVFSPITDLLSGSRKLLIIPDGPLALVPFDALIRRAPEDMYNLPSFSYLLKDFQISYNYSATLLREMSESPQRRSARKTWLGVAPAFTGEPVQDAPRFGFSPLPLNQQEVETIQSLVKGEVLMGAAATKRAFLSAAPDYQILHLSTHGYGNRLIGDNSFLAFSEVPNQVEDEFLFARELYAQQLNADLVVLSACETSLGQLQRGEGIISLARGFSFAGVRSMVTSLWTVSDRSTVDLLRQFYEQLLNEGLPKDEALWQAKKYLLSGEFQEPYYWAAFIPVGDMTAMVSPKKGLLNHYWWLFALLVTAGLLLFGWPYWKGQE